jgi:hypothetical protein
MKREETSILAIVSIVAFMAILILLTPTFSSMDMFGQVIISSYTNTFTSNKINTNQVAPECTDESDCNGFKCTIEGSCYDYCVVGTGPKQSVGCAEGYSCYQGGCTKVDLLQDTDFALGFKEYFENNLRESERCEMPLANDPHWMIVEVATETHFCSNLPNPKSTFPEIIIKSEGSHKRFTSNLEGDIILELDSSQEENSGCSITNERTPESSWIHYGINQMIDEDVANLADYEEINFNIDAKLNKFKANIPFQNCMIYDAPVAKYGGLVMVFLLRDKGKGDDPGDWLWIVFDVCSKHWYGPLDQSTKECSSNRNQNLQKDQFGIVIYNPPMGDEHPALEANGEWQTYNFDLKEIAKDAIDYYNDENHNELDVDDYYIEHFQFGWEIMGGFDTELELRDISLQGKLE